MAQTNEIKKASRFNDLFSSLGVYLTRNNRMKILNCCISINLIFSFSIFGYISLQPIATTTVHIPVIIAAMLGGPFAGAVTGLVFGLTSMWKANVSGTAYGDIIFSPWKSGDVFGSLVLSVGMRVLFGFIAGLLFSLLFKKADKKWCAAGSAVIGIVSTMIHSFVVTLAMVIFFPKAQTSLLGSIEPSVRHIAVWSVTGAVLVIAYLMFSSNFFISQYKEVIEYKRTHKTQSNRFMLYMMLVFLLVSAAIVTHSFERLALINVTDSNGTAKTDISAVHIALQQLIAMAGVIYLVAILLIFVYEKGNIASSRLQEKEQEEIFRKKLQKTLDVMQALSSDYEVVLNMDLEADTVTMYRCSEEMLKIVDDASLEMPFYEAGERFFRMIAAPEELPVLLELTTKEKILGYLENNQMFVHVFKNKNGRYGESKIVPISRTEFVCGYTDVDDVMREKMKQQEKLEKAMREAEAANKAKSAFLLNMSHDIRTPMNAIIGYTEILAKYRQDEKEFERCTGNIKASGKYLMDLINKVLEMARIESGVEELHEEPCDIRTIMGNTYIVFKEEAEKKGIKLTYDRNIRHNYLFCDSVRLQEMHLNIISNAIKYTESGGSIKIISTELPDEREGWCRIETTTTDTGRGMSEEFVEHIFDEFAREQDSTSSGTPGTGLGMGIVKKFVDMMGGEIVIESQKGKGTSVRITIPHRIADESLVEKQEDRIAPDASLFKDKRVLLAEDNDLNADLAIELLNDVGLQVDRASDGIICVSMLETAEAGYYDLILMDVQMPNMDGYKATEIIRNLADKKKAAIPIIAMTANAFARDRKQALSSGMNEHISKPISIEKLVSVMSEFISK